MSYQNMFFVIIRICIVIIVFQKASFAQYNCSTAHIVPSLPFVETDTTSSGTSFQASGFCGGNINYDEQDYIFSYTPVVDEFLDVYLEHNNFLTKCGVYVFTDCALPPTECVEFGGGYSSAEVSFVANAGIEYFIFIGTETPDFFFVEITKESIDGVAINKSEPTQTLDVNGSIRIGESTTTPYKGTIRWNDNTGDFEGYDGTDWVVLSNLPETIPPLELGNPIFSGQSKYASDGGATDLFGRSVSISGDLAIVGAFSHNTNGNFNQGQAYIFRKIDETWIEEAILISSDGMDNDFFGRSVSISGNYALVGAWGHDVNGNENQGKAYVFRRSYILPNGPFIWTEQATLVASDGEPNDVFGRAVSINDETIIVGSELHDTDGNEKQGKAYIYKKSGNTWTEEAVLVSWDGAENDLFGSSVSISGNYAVVGSRDHDTNGNADQGKAYVYRRQYFLPNGPFVWLQEAILTASDGQSEDQFGFAVAIDADYIVVGAPEHEVDGTSNQGKSYVFKRDGTIWTEVSILTSPDGLANDHFGRSVSISGDYIVVGVPGSPTNLNATLGKAYVFKNEDNLWPVEAVLTSLDGVLGDNFGRSVSISGENVIVGVPNYGPPGQIDKGKIYFF